MNDFIKENIEKYGFLGSNFTSNPDRGFFQAPNKNLEFTLDSHLKFGYNGRTNNYRKSSSDIFWADFGNVSRPISSLEEEIKNSIKIIYDKYGKVAFTKNINQSTWLIELAKECKIDFDEIEVDIRIDGFTEFMEKFCETSRCVHAQTIQQAFALELTNLPIIFDDNLILLGNMSFNKTLERNAAPYYWVMMINERNFSINRYLNSINRISFPNISFYTPESILSYFLDNRVIDLFKIGNFYNDLKNNDLVNKNIKNAKNSLKDIEYENSLDEISEILKPKYDKCEEIHCIPINRILKKYDIKYSFNYGKYEEFYGTVF